jgi:hypothetical protein
MEKFIFIFLLCPILICSQDSTPYTAGYIMEWGDKDTIAIETFTLYNNQVYGKAIHGFPDNHVRHFYIEYNQNGSINDLTYMYNDIANTSLPIDSETGMLPLWFSAKLYHGLLDCKILEKTKPDSDLKKKEASGKWRS